MENPMSQEGEFWPWKTYSAIWSLYQPLILRNHCTPQFNTITLRKKSYSGMEYLIHFPEICKMSISFICLKLKRPGITSFWNMGKMKFQPQTLAVSHTTAVHAISAPRRFVSFRHSIRVGGAECETCLVCGKQWNVMLKPQTQKWYLSKHQRLIVCMAQHLLKGPETYQHWGPWSPVNLLVQYEPTRNNTPGEPWIKIPRCRNGGNGGNWNRP